jgi:hypothetical protein
MICVPDVGHRQWDRSPRADDPPLSAPWLEEITVADERGRRLLSWSPVSAVRGYRVQSSQTSDFEIFEEWRLERPSRLSLMNGDESMGEPAHQLMLTLDPGCPRNYYFRVRAVGYSGSSAWSNTLALRIPESAFHSCAHAAIEVLGLILDVAQLPQPGLRRLQWTADAPAGLDPGVLGFELQSATESDFIRPTILYSGDLTHKDVSVAAPGRHFFRVRALTSQGGGPWSNIVILDPDALRTETLCTTEAYDPGDLLAVQLALVRLCASRADLVALLSLPPHYRETELNRHLIALGVNAG